MSGLKRTAESEVAYGWAGSHWRPLLWAVDQIPDGRILELGAGWFSTPFLHVVRGNQEREILTVDSDKLWLDRFSELASDTHKLLHVEAWWDYHYFYKLSWSVALIDQCPNEARVSSINRLRDRVSILVLHDTQEDFFIEPLKRWQFKYSYTYADDPATTLLSDFLDVRAAESLLCQMLPSSSGERDMDSDPEA